MWNAFTNNWLIVSVSVGLAVCAVISTKVIRGNAVQKSAYARFRHYSELRDIDRHFASKFSRGPRSASELCDFFWSDRYPDSEWTSHPAPCNFLVDAHGVPLLFYTREEANAGGVMSDRLVARGAGRNGQIEYDKVGAIMPVGGPGSDDWEFVFLPHDVVQKGGESQSNRDEGGNG